MTPHYEDAWLTVYAGDCRAVLAEMEPDSVQTVVTSPPYFGLRDYGVDGQIGLESSIEEYVAALVDVMGGVRRVLRPDGTLWLNLGDSYASHDPGGTRQGEHLNPGGRAAAKGSGRNRAGTYRPAGLKAKDRMMIPARVALALQADGWWLRDEIVWAKPNPMPSSVADRTTPSHEMVYLLTKRARYHYDADAIRELAQSGPSDIRKMVESRERVGGLVKASTDRMMAASGLTNVGRKRSVGGKPLKQPAGWNDGDTADDRVGRYSPGQVPRGWANGPDRGHDPRIGRYQPAARDKTAEDPNARGARQAPEPGEPNAFHPLGRNRRSVWTVATQPYPAAHFATFPEALITPMILAGCPVDGVVLDPFAGSGTVAVVAQRLGRRAVLIDLSPEYVGQMIERIAAGRGAGEGPAIDMPVPFADDGLWGEIAG